MGGSYIDYCNYFHQTYIPIFPGVIEVLVAFLHPSICGIPNSRIKSLIGQRNCSTVNHDYSIKSERLKRMN